MSARLQEQKTLEHSTLDHENRLYKLEIEVRNNLMREMDCMRSDICSIKDQLNMKFSEQMAKIWNEIGLHRVSYDKFMNEMDCRLKLLNEEYVKKINDLQDMERKIDEIIKKW